MKTSTHQLSLSELKDWLSGWPLKRWMITWEVSFDVTNTKFRLCTTKMGGSEAVNHFRQFSIGVPVYLDIYTHFRAKVLLEAYNCICKHGNQTQSYILRSGWRLI